MHEIAEKDNHNNALSADCLHLEATNNCIIHLPKGKGAVIKGMNDFIIVVDGIVLLIYPKEKEQEIKPLAAKMAATYVDEYL